MSVVKVPPDASVVQLEKPLTMLKLPSVVKLLEVHVRGSSETIPPTQYADAKPLVRVGLMTKEVADLVTV